MACSAFNILIRMRTTDDGAEISPAGLTVLS